MISIIRQIILEENHCILTLDFDKFEAGEAVNFCNMVFKEIKNNTKNIIENQERLISDVLSNLGFDNQNFIDIESPIRDAIFDYLIAGDILFEYEIKEFFKQFNKNLYTNDKKLAKAKKQYDNRIDNLIEKYFDYHLAVQPGLRTSIALSILESLSSNDKIHQFTKYWKMKTNFKYSSLMKLKTVFTIAKTPFLW